MKKLVMVAGAIFLVGTLASCKNENFKDFDVVKPTVSQEAKELSLDESSELIKKYQNGYAGGYIYSAVKKAKAITTTYKKGFKYQEHCKYYFLNLLMILKAVKDIIIN